MVARLPQLPNRLRNLFDQLVVSNSGQSLARYLRTGPNTLQKTRKGLLVFCVLARLKEQRRVIRLHRTLLVAHV